MLSELLTHFFRAFLVGGAVCLIGQLLFDAARLTPAPTMRILVCSGSVLGVLGLWPALADFAGYGAALPIVNFGSMLTEGALQGAAKDGFIGLFTGMYKTVSAGMTAAVAAGFAVALLFRPKA